MKTFCCFLLLLSFYAQGQDSLNFTRTEIIYGRKDGVALTMQMEVPKQRPNGKAIINVISGNWRSGYDYMTRLTEGDKIYLNSGYIVFAVIPSSQPRYPIPDQVEDVKRAVKFIRYHAGEYGFDPSKIGITGASSGGHLALMVATADDNANNRSKDPVETVSSRVQAAAVFYPPTDFLNFGQQGFNPAASQAILAATGLAAAFDFKRWNDTTRTYVSITDMETRLAIAKQNSPIYSVTSDDPPVMIVHGDADRLVPMQQSQSIIQKLEEAHVPNKLIVKSGGGHGWRNNEVEQQYFLDWFDKYLK